MKERPILMNAAMVRAILEGRKSQTRRPYSGPLLAVHEGRPLCQAKDGVYRKPVAPWSVGDRLWVRETWRIDGVGRKSAIEFGGGDPSLFKNLSFFADCEFDHGLKPGPWIPSIHMPRWASRIALEVMGVRVERVQDITEAGARSEGVPPSWLDVNWETVNANAAPTFRQGFARTWSEIFATRGLGWAANPWVWVVEFRRIET